MEYCRETAKVSFPYRYGLDSIPEDWLKKYTFADEVLGYIETVVTL